MRLFKHTSLPIEKQMPYRYYEITIDNEVRWVDLFAMRIVLSPKTLVSLKEQDLETDWSQTLGMRSVGLLKYLLRHSCAYIRPIDLNKTQFQLKHQNRGKVFSLGRLYQRYLAKFLSKKLWIYVVGGVTCLLLIEIKYLSFRALIRRFCGVVK